MFSFISDLMPVHCHFLFHLEKNVKRVFKPFACCGRSLGTLFFSPVYSFCYCSLPELDCLYWLTDCGGRKAWEMELVLLGPGKQWAKHMNTHAVCGLRHPILQEERGTRSKHGAQHQEIWSSRWPCFGLGWAATTWFLSISPSAKKYEKYLPHMED